MYVCICHGVTERAIAEARRRGIASIEQLGAETGCGSTCGSCRPLAEALLADGGLPSMTVEASRHTARALEAAA